MFYIKTKLLNILTLVKLGTPGGAVCCFAPRQSGCALQPEAGAGPANQHHFIGIRAPIGTEGGHVLPFCRPGTEQDSVVHVPEVHVFDSDLRFKVGYGTNRRKYTDGIAFNQNLEAGRGSTVETLLRVLKALEGLAGLDALAPPVSPLALLDQGGEQQRVSRPRKRRTGSAPR